MKEPTRPLSESYWVLPGRLLAGEYPGQPNPEFARQRLDALLEAGFDLFIDLTNQNEMAPYADLLSEQARAYGITATHQRFAIGDFGLPTVEQMKTILDTIDAGLAAGRKVYLHCWGGIGRTGTTVGCYLVRHGKSGEEALEQISQWWRRVPKSIYHPYSPETSQQMGFILHWKRHDRKP